MMSFRVSHGFGRFGGISMLSSSSPRILASPIYKIPSTGQLKGYQTSRWMSMNAADGKNLKWSSAKVRDTFVDYFSEKHAHTHFKSSPVVPVNDNSILFANAGMNQFKSIFIGTADPNSPLVNLSRAVNSQKCIRAGGKHNDLDDVGKDSYHHTFFEMLGTWSFGNYFKREAIHWAYDLLVNVYKLPIERIYVSYFGGDEELGLPVDTEARDLWLEFLPPERVLPFDKKANFWEMGDTGPCGPCSEIHFDRIGNRDAASLVNADDPNVIEIWNLVFMQYNREPSGELRHLPSKHIDTGMGLERLTSILQNKFSNYDTDIFTPLLKSIEEQIGCAPYTGLFNEEDAIAGHKDMAYRVIADHIRTLSCAIADGAIPSNEGRGYVLRRMIRRAIRYGTQNLGAEPGFLSKLVSTSVDCLGGYFPELKLKQEHITSVIVEEEESFSTLLERGIKYLNHVVAETKARGETQISGNVAFYLFDTLGFPLDLTEIMANELGLSVDSKGFTIAMENQKERGRRATKSKKLAGRQDLTLGAEQTAFLQNSGIHPTNDSYKYEWDTDVSTKVRAIFANGNFIDSDAAQIFIASSSATIGIIMDKTSFYYESGGQISDSGTIEIGSTILDVVDVRSYGGYILHICVPSEGTTDVELNDIIPGAHAVTKVDYNTRRKIAPNHSMTHVLNHALRQVLGEGVEQKGSLVSDDKFRFDFNYNRGMKTAEIRQVEELVADSISNKVQICSSIVPLAKARIINGLQSVFGEVYPDPVRVISIGANINELLADPLNEKWKKTSIEFCGGTHLSNTLEAESFVITEETAIAKGIRRVTGITGPLATEAKGRSIGLIQETLVLEDRVNSLTSSSEPMSERDVNHLQRDVVVLKASLNELVVAQTIKSDLKERLDQCAKILHNERTKSLLLSASIAIKKASDEAVHLSESGVTAAVLHVNIGSNAKSIKFAIDEIHKAAPNLAFLALSESPEDNKLSCFSFVPTGHDIKANEWITKTLAACGGKGGGTPNMAQGSLNSYDVDRVKAAYNAAHNFISN